MILTRTKTGMAILAALAALIPGSAEEHNQPAKSTKVTLLRTPGHGIQPQVVMDEGVLHLIYFGGKDSGGDIFYARSDDEGSTFSKPIRVNSQPGSAIAVGNIRGAHLAVGKKGRIHVAWLGSGKAEPKGTNGESPMLYARLNDAGTAFEDQRNIIQNAFGLDGGGSVAADAAGNVYVAWHAPDPGTKGEANRRVWVARSHDEGKTFAPETAASPKGTGACGCCGMRAFGDRKGNLYLMYRSAAEQVNRDTYLLVSKNRGTKFAATNLHQWNVGICPMSSFAFAETPTGVLAAWETKGQVFFTHIDPVTGKNSALQPAPGDGKGRKHPGVAGNTKGETILVWTEGMGWNQGGSLAWQVFDNDCQPTAEKGHASGVPVWSLVAVFARSDGKFAIVY
jgi:hypothetical protein